MLSLLIVPLSIFGFGLLVGFAAARLAARAATPAARRFPIALIVLGVPLAVHGAMFAFEAARYTGQCSGFRERGAHACSRLEFALQDWELGLLFTAVPTLAAIAVALVAFFRLRPRLPA